MTYTVTTRNSDVFFPIKNQMDLLLPLEKLRTVFPIYVNELRGFPYKLYYQRRVKFMTCIIRREKTAYKQLLKVLNWFWYMGRIREELFT